MNSTLSKYTDNDPTKLNMRLRLSIFRNGNSLDYPQFRCRISAIQQGLSHAIGNLYLVKDQWSLFRQSVEVKQPAMHTKVRRNSGLRNKSLYLHLIVRYTMALICKRCSGWASLHHCWSGKKRVNVINAFDNTICCFNHPLIVRFVGPTWGPYGADRTQVGPMLAPWTLLSGYHKWTSDILPTYIYICILFWNFALNNICNRKCQDYFYVKQEYQK